MPQQKKYPYQTNVMISADDGKWIDHVSVTDDIDKAQVLRMAIGAGLDLMEKNPEEIEQALAQEPIYQKGVKRYPYQAGPILSPQMSERIDRSSTHHRLKRSIVIRTAIALGRPVIERRRKAIRKIAA